MVGGSLDVFTKRMLVEKHISSIMCDNPVEHPYFSLLSSADAHVRIILSNTVIILIFIVS